MRTKSRMAGMAILVVLFATAVLPLSPAAGSSAGIVNASVTVRQRVALTLNPAATSADDAVSTQSNVDNSVTSEWIPAEKGTKLLITVVAKP